MVIKKPLGAFVVGVLKPFQTYSERGSCQEERGINATIYHTYISVVIDFSFMMFLFGT